MADENMTIFKDLIMIFKYLSGSCFKTVLPNSKFRKLGYISCMKNSKFGKNEIILNQAQSVIQNVPKTNYQKVYHMWNKRNSTLLYISNK